MDEVKLMSVVKDVDLEVMHTSIFLNDDDDDDDDRTSHVSTVIFDRKDCYMMQGVHDVKLHHPSSSVATSNQWCWSGIRGNINKLLLIVVMCCILLLHILWSGLQVGQIGFCLTGSISL